ncbi:hypothetical protein QE152_g12700 [Popillia japonica]|uniref:Uncharacterized protein n=1 Tax=Popillia japonica TaxID=7064 RepID=A0AAW1LR02_POPJA
MGYLKASKHFHVPETSFEVYINRGKSLEEQCALRMGRKPVLSPEMEEDLIARVVTLKGRKRKQLGALTAAERGALVTEVICMNAAGGFVPPLFIFPRKNMKAELLDRAALSGSIADCHP